MECSEVKKYLSDFGESGMADLTVIRDHIESCAECRTERAQLSELKSALESLAGDPVEVPSWLEGRITEMVVQRAARQAALQRLGGRVAQPKVLTGGALLAAGVAGALLVRRRTRRQLTGISRLRQALANA